MPTSPRNIIRRAATCMHANRHDVFVNLSFLCKELLLTTESWRSLILQGHSYIDVNPQASVLVHKFDLEIAGSQSPSSQWMSCTTQRSANSLFGHWILFPGNGRGRQCGEPQFDPCRGVGRVDWLINCRTLTDARRFRLKPKDEKLCRSSEDSRVGPRTIRNWNYERDIFSTPFRDVYPMTLDALATPTRMGICLSYEGAASLSHEILDWCNRTPKSSCQSSSRARQPCSCNLDGCGMMLHAVITTRTIHPALLLYSTSFFNYVYRHHGPPPTSLFFVFLYLFRF